MTFEEDRKLEKHRKKFFRNSPSLEKQVLENKNLKIYVRKTVPQPFSIFFGLFYFMTIEFLTKIYHGKFYGIIKIFS